MPEKAACVLIHGFGGGIHEIEPLASRLEADGHPVLRTRLSGHTGRRRDMRRATHQDWIRSAEKDYLEAAALGGKVVLIGFSTGGLIAAQLAARYPVSALVTVSTPIYVWDIRRIVSNVKNGIRSGSAERLRFYAGSAVRFPLSSLIHFKLLLFKTRPLFSGLACPIYVLQGLDDDTVHRKSAGFIYGHSRPDRRFIDYFEPSGHVLLNGPAAAEAIRKIEAFIQTV